MLFYLNVQDNSDDV